MSRIPDSIAADDPFRHISVIQEKYFFIYSGFSSP